MKQTSENLSAMRHSAAHLLAAAVLQLWPGSHNAIGPAIENGFYQDFDMGAIKLSDTDLPKIEKKMKELLPTWTHFEFNEVSLEEAKKLFKHNPYKLELAEEFAVDGKKLLTNNPGNFLDLCKMDHAENPSKELKNFKLLSIAGAYWRGNEKNKMLTRIYGTVFPTKDELAQYLESLAEAEKRDHRKLGKQLDLFLFSELVGSGLALWTPRGTLVRNLLDDYIWQLRKERGYQKVTIPHITKKDLYETSGHWEKFKDDLFKITTREGHDFAMKPMNCPHHTQIYARKLYSYRELPQRYTETTMVYRDEQSGELAGLSRVRCITQDDAHIFCRESQIKEEMFKIWDIINTFYTAVGLGNLTVRLSLHDPSHMEKYLGAKEVWRKTESQLRELVHERHVTATEAIGEAAMYGPKIDFIARDSLGRAWQVATIQIDRNIPERFDLVCINEEGGHERVVMLHAAIMGSTERFLSILIEHFAGKFPLWISPVQVAILPVSELYTEAAKQLATTLETEGIRTEVDASNETVGKKIRLAEKSYVPYMIVMGEKEATSDILAIRIRGQKDMIQLSRQECVARIKENIQSKSLDLTLAV